MATTNRRKKIDIPEQQVIEVEEIVPEKKEFLSPDHLRQLETIDRDIQIAKLSMAVEEQALKNLILEYNILQTKIEKQKILLMEKSKFYDNQRVMFTNFKKELWPQYGLGEASGLGYDPNTGKIICDN